MTKWTQNRYKTPSRKCRKSTIRSEVKAQKFNGIDGKNHAQSIDHVTTRKRTKYKPWKTTEILDMIENRRRYKHNAKKYHELSRIVKLLCIEAKENFLNTKCEKIAQTVNCTPKQCH